MNAFLRIIKKLLSKLNINCFDTGTLHYMCGGEALPQPFSREEEEAIILRLDEGDSSAKSALIEHNLRLVVYIAKRFENTGADMEDLISVGSIGLIKAVNSFNSGKNIKLATYASRCIENEILMYLRKLNKLKSEVSLDEPLNTDWEGNVLLLGDVLGTDADVIDIVHKVLFVLEVAHHVVEKLAVRGQGVRFVVRNNLVNAVALRCVKGKGRVILVEVEVALCAAV